MGIYRIESDFENTNELDNGLRNRVLGQKFLYLGEGAKYFLERGTSSTLSYDDDLINSDDFSDFGKKYIFKKGEKIALVSLGCGDSSKEEELLSNLTNYNIDYFGVDSSEEMLNASDRNLKNVKNNYKLICADFSKNEFRSELKQLTKTYDDIIFAFFGNTFGNINHTNIIDILYNTLNKGDKIWLNVAKRPLCTTKEDMKIFNIYENFGNTGKEKNFMLSCFKKCGIPEENGHIKRVMEYEESINALRIKFYFVFDKKTEIQVKGKIIFLPTEKIKFLQIYYYDPTGLKSFFAEHHFENIANQEKNYQGQFLFERK